MNNMEKTTQYRRRETCMRKEERERPVREEHVREEGDELEGGGRGALGREEGKAR